MIHFAWWWVLFAAPLPWLLRWLAAPLEQKQQTALRAPFLNDFSSAEVTHGSIHRRWPFWLAIFAWLALVMAAARPQWLGDPLEIPVSGRDLLLAVDLSGSMEVQDFQLNGKIVDRLTATKAVAAEFIQRRQGDRLGLILFGENAYLQTPLTFDRVTVTTLLMESAIGLAGKQTAIGDAIGLAVKRLKDSEAQHKVLILVTDGANTAGAVSPVRAAQLAAASGMKIYTIGIGADELIQNTIFGRRIINPSRDLDEKTLTEIAEETAGQYFRARDTQQLEQIYTELDRLEPYEQEPLLFRPVKALYMWPLGLVMLSAIALLILRARGHLEA